MLLATHMKIATTSYIFTQIRINKLTLKRPSIFNIPNSDIPNIRKGLMKAGNEVQPKALIKQFSNIRRYQSSDYSLLKNTKFW